jgi:hypothetical protein
LNVFINKSKDILTKCEIFDDCLEFINQIDKAELRDKPLNIGAFGAKAASQLADFSQEGTHTKFLSKEFLD